ncbi:hypothetical protein C7B61_18490 [filamentous cyanobacterium CCP1]|nr:hypothetical protein C7B76_24845 [filamentous cyanobacterium CCP2]PSB59839.1 hypothetical protein C7B61_18490 [filamentous cyanobacterium CCP1]
MQYSLRDRFRGALLGAVLGEILGSACEKEAAHSVLSWQTLSQEGFIAPVAVNGGGWGKFIMQEVNRLVQPLGSEAKTEPSVRSLSNILSTTSILNTQSDDPSLAPLSAGCALMTIPIALFYHDDMRYLPRRIEQAIEDWQQPASHATGAIVIGYTLALALQEKLYVHDLIPRLLTDLEIVDRDPLLAQQLQQVQVWLEQGSGLSTVKTLIAEPIAPKSSDPTIDLTPIAIALYGFLSTPAHFKLSLLRTARLQYYPQTVCCLVGALSGVHNRTAGIPLGWQLHLMTTSSKVLTELWSTSPTSIIQQADLLLGQWSGAHDPLQWSASSNSPSPLVAVPNLIRPQPNFPP